ncbi:GDSL-type esterase/lipase family protein [Microcoleus sp. FACHB-672]|uniref:GDSL-type esterase/lipase family protein n=1 Tax=Microcoleus sp. FACHB-672 TaxID=2692825 RepID=UPI0016867B11|nr:GDSL-type esterase/lipase family protein [Microcoleus sp. FACHB-672]MBD2042552.1 G-D-S-L family lipolytic protein [Microcoleus sp. FACHB-672]
MQTLEIPVSKSLHQANPHPLKIVALGDSIVYGFGDPEGGGWVERLRRRWMFPDSAGHVLYNLGVRGDSVRQVAGRLEMEFRHRGELRNRLPDVLLLSVGLNDCARLSRPNGRNYIEFDVFQEDLANLLDLSQRLCPVLFVGMVPVDETKMPFLNCFYYNHTDQYRYKEATRQACLDRQIPYLDIFEQWMARGEEWQRSRLGADGLHPNVAGYQALLQDALNWKPIAELAAKKQEPHFVNF